MRSTEVLRDAFDRLGGDVHDALAGLDPDALTLRMDPDANSIAWLVWHLTRVQDDHVADLAGTAQVYTAQGWAGRFALPFDTGAIGYGHTSEQVAAVRAGGDLLTGYFEAVHAHTDTYLAGLADADLDEVVDERWDPPVTRGVRLVSVLDDGTQHAGQAAFVAGIARRARAGGPDR